ncbi:uncharacterized protein LOC128549391 [Mercenaria mercenaria]|uniref:uncharacterized protein LOC128549391 n=1 Tax=Mercenaria mercenaria TaxID=6596 RepID=UPI00234EE1AA|nr:uncharacterized protein LOC128549391 [Mercenaria mercenaria]
MSGSENRKSGRPTTRHDYGKVNEIGFGDDDTGNPSENSDNQDGATGISTAVFSPVKNKKDETLALLQSQLQSLDQEEEELRKDAEITKLQKRIEQKKKSVAELRDKQFKELKQDLKVSNLSAYASGSRKNLKIQWESFILFCLYFHLQYLPAETYTLQLYAQLSRPSQIVLSQYTCPLSCLDQ